MQTEPGTSSRSKSWLPTIRGIIDRRILVNYRVDPEILARLLPAPFRPQKVNGWGLAGICLIRMKQIRPSFAPAFLGIASENAAHRIAVEWNESETSAGGGGLHQGVYIRRRDTNSWINCLAGGRIFPGQHNAARFEVDESADRFHVSLCSTDQATRMSVTARLTDHLPADSIFRSVAEVSNFFQAGSLGYSDSCQSGRFQGLTLQCRDWHVDSLEVEEASSSLFDDPSLFPPGSIALDNALLMRGIEHTWRSEGELCCSANAASAGQAAETHP